MLRIDSLIPTATSLEDPFADPTPSVFQSLVPVIVIDNTPLPSIAMIAVKIYVFGGLGFIIGVVLVAIAYWIWVVVIKREYADSPPWLDLHPERMREKEKLREARLKVQKAEREARKKIREEEKWVDPARCWTTPRLWRRSSSTKDTPKLKSALRTKTFRSKGESTQGSTVEKHVSWATSASTLDRHGNVAEEPLVEHDDDNCIASSRICLDR